MTQIRMDQSQTAQPWVIILSSFMIISLGACHAYGSGVLYTALLERYHEPVTKTTWLGSMSFAVFALAAPLGSVVINIYTCRLCVLIGGVTTLVGYGTSFFVNKMDYLFVTLSLTTGIGQSLCYTGGLIILGYYFEENPSLATGIVVTGAGVGMLAMPPFTQFLINTYSLQGAFLILGVTGFQTCVFGSLLRPHPLERKRKIRVEHNKISQNFFRRFNFSNDCLQHIDIFTNVQFLSFLACCLTWCAGVGIALLYLPAYYVSRGSTDIEASFLVTFVGIGSIISRILVGLFVNDETVNARMVFFALLGLAGTSTCFLTLYTGTYAGKVASSLVLGLYTGGEYSIFSAVLLEMMGLERLASSVGASLLVCGIGYLVGPPMAGKMRDMG
ncbi:hypothetical protein ScPMuIL_017916 [Solemya velum]